MPHDGPTLILVALEAELLPLARRLGLRRESEPLIRAGSFGEHGLIAAATGMGRGRAATEADRLIQAYSPRRVLVSGTAAGAGPSLKTADVLTPAVVIDAATERRFSPTLPTDTCGTLVSVDEIVDSAQAKAALHRRWSADAIDMESAAIAQACDRRSIPWLCVRAILDPADTALPPALGSLTTPDGRTRPLVGAAYALSHPWRIRTLLRLGRDTHRAMTAVADRLLALL